MLLLIFHRTVVQVVEVSWCIDHLYTNPYPNKSLVKATQTLWLTKPAAPSALEQHLLKLARTVSTLNRLNWLSLATSLCHSMISGLNNRPSKMVNQQAPRRGHAAIRSIIEEMVGVLPPEKAGNPAYVRCHTTFGLLKGCLDKAEQGDSPEKQYKELQIVEDTLRRRLDSLNPVKPIPEPMLILLDELREAVKEALEHGVNTDFVIKSLEDMIAAPEPTLAEKDTRRPPKMVTETRLKHVWDELQQTKEANRRLNDENNDLALRLKRAESEIERLRRNRTTY